MKRVLADFRFNTLLQPQTSFHMKYILFVVVVFFYTSSSVRAQKQCYVCDAALWSNCSNVNPWCDRGPTQCYSGYAGYKDDSGNLQYKFLKGCLDCTNSTIGCDNLKKRMITEFNLNITNCYVSCCDENNCNTKEPVPPKPPSSSSLIGVYKGLGALPLSLLFLFYFL